MQLRMTDVQSFSALVEETFAQKTLVFKQNYVKNITGKESYKICPHRIHVVYFLEIH